MNAVNLLPPKHRPRQATGSRKGSSYVLLGILGVIVVGVLVYVLTANSINSAKSDIAQAKAETLQANAQADALGSYGDFAKIKAERVKAVQDLATGRTDWERVLREVAHVLPDGVWITGADAADTPSSNSASGGSTGSGSGSGSTGGGSTGGAQVAATSSGPQITLNGCSPTQQSVADTIVRLRELQGATDVQLDHSTRAEAATSAGSGNATGSSSGSSGSSNSTGCGETHGVTNYDFQVTVSLKAPAPAADSPGKVPASLGGGQ